MANCNILKSAKIFINGRFLTQPITGVQRYALELLNQMDKLLSDNIITPKLELICLVPPQDLLRPSWKHIEVKSTGWNRGNVWEQLDLPLSLKGQLLFSPANIGPWYYASQIVTLHDASIFAFPNAYSLAFRTKYKFIFKQLVNRAAHILTDSEFSQRELARYLKVDQDRFSVIPLGSDHMDFIQPDPSIIKRKYLRRSLYFLVVASRSRHKNYEVVVKAARTIDESVKIVTVGGNFGRVFRNKEMTEIPSNIINIGYVSDQELKALYQNSLGFIMPSLYEGFGLPVLEAMRSGCPVISSNAASLVEVAGDAVLYFDPTDANDLVEAICRLISDTSLREELREKGYQHAEKYKWSVTAQKTLDKLSDAL